MQPHGGMAPPSTISAAPVVETVPPPAHLAVNTPHALVQPQSMQPLPPPHLAPKPTPTGCAHYVRTIISLLVFLILFWTSCVLLFVCQWRGFCFAESVNARRPYSSEASNGFVPVGLCMIILIAPLSSCGGRLQRMGLAAVMSIVDVIAAILLFVAGVATLALAPTADQVAATLWQQLLPSSRTLRYGGALSSLSSEVQGDMIAVGASALAGACLLILLGVALATLTAQLWQAQRWAVQTGAALRMSLWGIAAGSTVLPSSASPRPSPLASRPFGGPMGQPKGAHTGAPNLPAHPDQLPVGHPDGPALPGAHASTLSTHIVTCACCPGGGPCSVAVADVVSTCCWPSVCPCRFSK